MEKRFILPEKYRKFSSFALKRIAVASMIIDHVGSIVMDGVLAPFETDGYIYYTADMPFVVRNAMQIKNVCEILGSIAFPIFCFLVVEGFMHTHDRVKYGLRMAAFALVSEIPYDLAHYGKPFVFSLQNVMFTLCVGIFTLCAVSFVESRWPSRSAPRIALSALAVAAGAGLAFLIRSEYVFIGVAVIALLYWLRGTRWQLLALAPMAVVSPWALCAAIPLLMYSGERGRGSKYFFYIFYPAHFLVLAGIARLLANR